MLALPTLNELKELLPFLSEQERAEMDELLTTKRLTFREFVSLVNPRYRWYTHVERLADVLEQVAGGTIKRLMVFMPPRHGKSEEVSRLFAAYYLYLHPEHWVGINSYAADLAYSMSRAARENYQRAGGRLRGDTTAVHHWETGDGGGLWAAGVGGPITGKGFHLGIIDDPLKNAEGAASETIREKQKEWYQSTFYTREEPGGAIIVIQTRWHAEDLSGSLLAQEADDEPERWHIVSYEAIKEEQPPEVPPTCSLELDWREPGEPLCPERYDLAKLRKIARRITPYFWNALFQQRPQPREGGMFKRHWFEIVGAAPVEIVERVRYWDKAGADEGKGDWTVGVLMARDRLGYYYVEDVVRGQWTAHPRNRMIRQTAELDRQRFGGGYGLVEPDIWIEQPPGLAKESTDEIVRQLAGFNARADRVTRDKVERAEPFAAQAEAGNVKLVRGEWNSRYLDELTAFPTGAHDDQVDASSGAFNKLATGMDGWGASPFAGYRG